MASVQESWAPQVCCHLLSSSFISGPPWRLQAAKVSVRARWGPRRLIYFCVVVKKKNSNHCSSANKLIHPGIVRSWIKDAFSTECNVFQALQLQVTLAASSVWLSFVPDVSLKVNTTINWETFCTHKTHYSWQKHTRETHNTLLQGQ